MLILEWIAEKHYSVTAPIPQALTQRQQEAFSASIGRKEREELSLGRFTVRFWAVDPYQGSAEQIRSFFSDQAWWRDTYV